MVNPFKGMTRRQAVALLEKSFPKSSGQIDTAKDFLRQFLVRPRQTRHIYKEAEALGISRTTINRAAHQLKIKRTTSGFGKQKRTWWSR